MALNDAVAQCRPTQHVSMLRFVDGCIRGRVLDDASSFSQPAQLSGYPFCGDLVMVRLQVADRCGLVGVSPAFPQHVVTRRMCLPALSMPNRRRLEASC